MLVSSYMYLMADLALANSNFENIRGFVLLSPEGLDIPISII